MNTFTTFVSVDGRQKMHSGFVRCKTRIGTSVQGLEPNATKPALSADSSGSAEHLWPFKSARRPAGLALTPISSEA